MNLNPMLNELLQARHIKHIVIDSAYAVSAALLGATYFSLRTMICKDRLKSANFVEELTGKLDDANGAIEQLSNRIAELEARYAPAPEKSPEPASINLNRRGQVIRLHQRGQDPVAIASTLSISEGEVKLIIKMHDLSRSDSCEANAEKFALKSIKAVR